MPFFWPDAASFRADRAASGQRPAAAPARSIAPRGMRLVASALSPCAPVAGPARGGGGGGGADGARWVAATGAGRGMADLSHTLLVQLAALFSVALLLSPGIDLFVSGWFAGPSGSFPLAESHPLIALRDANRLLPPILLAGLLALLLAQGLGLRAPAVPRPHAVLFVLAFYALGPGLLVNGLKAAVGRARPRDIAEFGGTDLFTAPWQASVACARNCSFPSGEAGSAVAMLAFVFLLPRAWRRPALLALVPVAIAFSVNRILFGAHFLSDVVLSWLLCGAVMLWLRPVFTARADAIDAAVTGRLAARLREAASRPHRPAARPAPL